MRDPEFAPSSVAVSWVSTATEEGANSGSLIGFEHLLKSAKKVKKSAVVIRSIVCQSLSASIVHRCKYYCQGRQCQWGNASRVGVVRSVYV